MHAAREHTAREHTARNHTAQPHRAPCSPSPLARPQPRRHRRPRRAPRLHHAVRAVRRRPRVPRRLGHADPVRRVDDRTRPIQGVRHLRGGHVPGRAGPLCVQDLLARPLLLGRERGAGWLPRRHLFQRQRAHIERTVCDRTARSIRRGGRERSDPVLARHVWSTRGAQQCGGLHGVPRADDIGGGLRCVHLMHRRPLPSRRQRLGHGGRPDAVHVVR
eukprot:6650449-Prymnesium_polylepis.1